MKDPIVPELMQDGTSPSMISFAMGTPALSSFPTNAYRTAVDEVLRYQASAAIGVGATAGLMPLRETIAARMKLAPQNVLILSGAQQGLDLIARCLIDAGDAVIVDEPCFPGAIQALQAAGAVIHGWSVERWDIETLESLIIRYKPKMLYTNPTLQNPTGHSMSLDKRRDLLALAARYRLPIIEDDIHSNLFLDAAPPPTIVSLDKEDIVVYLNSFSKCLGPGIRIGWLVSSPFVVRQLSLIKMRANLFTEGLGQLAMLRLIKNGEFDRHLERLRLEHRLRASAAVQTMKQQFSPRMLSWTRPKGGLYIWCRLHNRMTTALVQKHAQIMNVSFAPGHLYFPEGNHDDYFRLCFAALPAEKIVTGITRLAAAVKRAYEEPAT
ncbi:MAG: PLP-dependent aminotransferase family protein [Acidobacteriaceae bacterium]